MTNKPSVFTREEVKEIAANEEFQKFCQVSCASDAIKNIDDPTTEKLKFDKEMCHASGDVFLVHPFVGKTRTLACMFVRQPDGGMNMLEAHQVSDNTYAMALE